MINYKCKTVLSLVLSTKSERILYHYIKHLGFLFAHTYYYVESFYFLHIIPVNSSNKCQYYNANSYICFVYFYRTIKMIIYYDI